MRFHSSSKACPRSSLLKVILSAAFLLCSFAHPSYAANSGFISAQGSHFLLDGKPFFFGGANCYFLMEYRADLSRQACVDELLAQADQLGLSVIRTWGFNDGNHALCLQCSPGNLNEQVFQALDYVLYRADALGLRVIIPLVNNWADYGGIQQYVDWAGGGSHDDFYDGQACRDLYKQYVSAVLNRRNTYNDRLYREDPTVMAWELCNEPRAQVKGVSVLNAWVAEMSAYVKSLDANHMVSVGIEGFYSSETYSIYNPASWMRNCGMDFHSTQDIPTVDFAVAHSLPDNWSVMDKSAILGLHAMQISDAHVMMSKPFVLEEFAKHGPTELRNEWFQDYLDLAYSNRAAGWMVWMLGCPSHRGGDDGYWIYPEDTDTLAIISAEASRMGQLVPDDVVPGVCSLRSVPVGTSVYTGEPQVVSAVFPGEFYVQEQCRCGSIRVLGSPPVEAGGTVRIAGMLKVDEAGAYLDPLYVDAMAQTGAGPRPLGMPIGSIGGQPPDGWSGSTSAHGMYNLGLLTRIWGRVVPPTPGSMGGEYTFFDRTDSLESGKGLMDMAYLFGEGGGSLESVVDTGGDPGVQLQVEFPAGPGWRDAAIGMNAPAADLSGCESYRLALRNDSDTAVSTCLFLEASGWRQSPWYVIAPGDTVTNILDLTGIAAPSGTIGLKLGANVGDAPADVRMSAVGYRYEIDDGSKEMCTVFGAPPPAQFAAVTGITGYAPDLGKTIRPRHYGDVVPICAEDDCEGDGAWSVTQNGDMLEIAYGSGTDFPQRAVIHLDSSYFRMGYGPCSGWGTSVILMPSFWAQGEYRQGAPVTCTWTTSGDDLLISFGGTISQLQAQGTIRLSPPCANTLSAQVTMNVTGSVQLDERPGEAFKSVMLSSMHISNKRWDAESACVGSQSFAMPDDGWIVQPPVSGTTLGLKGGTSEWKANAPTVEVTLDQSMPITGWVTQSANPNGDNVGFWAASDTVLTTWHYTIIAKSADARP